MIKVNEFRKRVLELIDKYSETYEGTLKEYLISFWHIIRLKKENEIDLELLCELIEQAFNSEPRSFDTSWLIYTNPPDISENEDEFKCFKDTILFQISDLHRMEDSCLLDNELKYFGIDSTEGNRWYNFDPFTYLECASAWLEVFLDSRSIQEIDFSWSMLIHFLEMGRLYE
ncbi:MAG: hypothetical protein N4A63_09920 [Vallitalea sp.]|nr:hypothetical protein [Vallitalea sp.]